jgi:predicted nucleic-acid-binding protein
MRAVDTNVLVRLVTRDDRKQVAAAETFVSKGAWVSTLVLVEATWVLTAVYELTHAEMATAIDMLFIIEISPSKSPIVSPRHSSNIATARRWGFLIAWFLK